MPLLKDVENGAIVYIGRDSFIKLPYNEEASMLLDRHGGIMKFGDSPNYINSDIDLHCQLLGNHYERVIGVYNICKQKISDGGRMVLRSVAILSRDDHVRCEEYLVRNGSGNPKWWWTRSSPQAELNCMSDRVFCRSCVNGVWMGSSFRPSERHIVHPVVVVHNDMQI